MPGEPIPESPQSPPAEPAVQTPRRSSLIGCLFDIAMLILVGLTILYFVGHLVTDDGGRILQAKAVAKGLEIAIEGYKTEYLRLPYVGETLPIEDNSAFDTTAPDGRALLDA